MTIEVIDEKTGEQLPCRIELRDSKGRPQKTRGGLNRPPWSIVEGQFVFRSKAGDYRFDVFHGPEYASGGGGFTLDRDGQGEDVIRLPRHADMAKEGWIAGDLMAAIPESEAGQWLPAEGLHMASVVAKSIAPPAQPNQVVPHVLPLAHERWVNAGGYYDDRPGSGLLFHHWHPPAAVPDSAPSSRLLVIAKQNPATHAEITRLWAADAPIWLASGRIDSIQILSEHLTRDGRSNVKASDMYHPEPDLFKGPRGPGRLVENLYWQVLETGLTIPPSAGSAVGRSSSPLGYNRIYVVPPDSLRTPEKWWEAMRSGRSFVTNGPLLRATVNEQLPGFHFQAIGGETLKLNVALTLTVADPVEYVDVVFNGEALYHARLDEYARQGGKIPLLDVKESGWLVIRVVAQREDTYRIASTAPYYIQFDGKPRISRRACELFLEWLKKTVREQKRDDPYSTAALEFWRKRADQSTSP